MIKLGDSELSNIKLGGSQIQKVYLGTNLIWQYNPIYTARFGVFLYEGDTTKYSVSVYDKCGITGTTTKTFDSDTVTEIQKKTSGEYGFSVIVDYKSLDGYKVIVGKKKIMAVDTDNLILVGNTTCTFKFYTCIYNEDGTVYTQSSIGESTSSTWRRESSTSNIWYCTVTKQLYDKWSYCIVSESSSSSTTGTTAMV